MSFQNLFIPHDRTATEEKWLKEEIAEQVERHKKICAEMEALTPQREIWYGEFLQRIQTRGFNFDGDSRRKIAPEDIPVKPDRPSKVTY